MDFLVTFLGGLIRLFSAYGPLKETFIEFNGSFGHAAPQDNSAGTARVILRHVRSSVYRFLRYEVQGEKISHLL